MSRTQRLVRMAIVAFAVVTLILIIRPKQWVVGGLVGGPLPPHATAYREEHACIGIKLIIPLGCADCGASYPCFGILTGRTCSIEEYDPALGLVRTPAACQDLPDPPEPVPPSGIVTVVVTVFLDPTARPPSGTPEPVAHDGP